MSTKTAPILRLAITADIRECLDGLRDIYPTMSDAELVKLTLGAYTRQIRPHKTNYPIPRNNFVSITQNFAKSRQASGMSRSIYQSIDTSPTNIDASSF